jgi:flagella basal body P-ring formation protein FlgA
MIPSLVFQLILPAASTCLTVPHDRVLAEDLAKIEPQFARLNPSLALIFAPLPGTQRVLSRRELLALLHSNGIDSSDPGGDYCIERKTVEMSEGDLDIAIRKAIDIDGLQVQIVDYSHNRMPPGIIQLKTGSIASHSSSKAELPVIWPGRLLYEGGSSSIWVKAVLWVQHKVVVTTVDLSAGQVIQSEGIRLEDIREFPLGNRLATSPEQVIGLKSRSPIRKDTPVVLSQLELPWTISKGEKVLVRVLAGSTHVSLEAIALSAGRAGDEISLRNPESGQAFRAVVEAKGVAFVSLRGSS